ncbi:acetyl-CoA carboxylase biotin carboxylase subunit [Acidiphilium iwatense]|uniref:Acetyl-CoA carboxylase biotin carboxylase subunit n=1 Tax=Acidiphilium iwatense TaxID=768198 RepID=A0ABS9E2F1_9PROT|nr:acetyl-CoA carboxylase biotin carboxylase subunit [Acidiphilium iwatense]MCF3948220.1 acetyl-CoA carboxylase biotin carboxylase subunit [Acidiphilium iwatense]
MFDAVLIANRGEIACRITRTARRFGIRSVAVYSEADAHAAHVAMADAAFCIGPAPARESYLDGARIIEAAHRAGASAIHPGYGFLSENADFAEACAAAGIVFIGPPAAAIRAMGSKSAAKALMEQAGVPLVPGYHGAEQDSAFLADEAGRIGYPVLIKASAGGGGKGMRIVTSADEFAMALDLAKGEARAAFGDDRVLIERYLTRPRHIEIQVFADTFGNVVSLFERDCSIQRRHQKIVEEAPAPFMTDARRRAMGEAACAAARAIGYVGAGTVEFIAEGDDFHFMEMNTRLQVEHPVTEAITGQDLVEWQFLVAAGEALPLTQERIPLRGHAVEVRIYAEDPARDFAPSIGTIRHLRVPFEDAHIRLDSGVREGDAIPIHYDPMIAKLIAWDEDRAGALRHLRRALAAFEIDGVQTNLDLLRRIAALPAFSEAELDTGFIARHAEALMPSAEAASDAVLAAGVHLWLRAVPVAPAFADVDPYSPWSRCDAWRLNGDGYQDVIVDDGIAKHRLRAYPLDDRRFRLALANQSIDVAVDETAPNDVLRVAIGGDVTRLSARRFGESIVVFDEGRRHALSIVDPYRAVSEASASSGRVTTVMPGRVVELAVIPGDTVAEGDLLVVVEAMKVQFRIVAPRAGKIAAVHCAAGELVEEGAELVTFDDTP